MTIDRLLAVNAPGESEYTPPAIASEPACRWAEDLDEPTCTAPVYVFIGGVPYCSAHGNIIYRVHLRLHPDRDIDVQMRRLDSGSDR
jgi:hypothetical protein